MFLVVYASFVGLCLESALLETDHWRHFFLLLGMIWGLVGAEHVSRRSESERHFVARGKRKTGGMVGAPA